MKEDKIVIYQTEDGQIQIDVRLENETVWLNVAQMASLFMKEESNVRRHVLNAFKEGELERDDNNVHFLHVNGVKKPVPFYSLDVIISVGYRVMRWMQLMVCVRSLEVQHFLVMKKTIPSRAVLDRSIRPLGARNSIPVLRRKQPCCSTW